MQHKQPKLRPSMSWEDMEIAANALDTCIRMAVTSNAVTLTTVKQDQVKRYLETFKPSSSAAQLSSVQALLATYGAEPQIVPVQAELVPSLESVPLAELTDDQRYDLLKLQDTKAWTTDDQKFMLNKGTMIMLQRASATKVTEEDL